MLIHEGTSGREPRTALHGRHDSSPNDLLECLTNSVYDLNPVFSDAHGSNKRDDCAAEGHAYRQPSISNNTKKWRKIGPNIFVAKAHHGSIIYSS